MKTFTTFRQELPVFEEQKDIFLEDLSSEELYSIISDDSASEEILENVILTLFARGEIELSEEDLQQTMSKSVGGIPLSFVAKRKEGIKQSAELQKQTMAPPKKPFKIDEPGSKIVKTSGGLVKFPSGQKNYTGSSLKLAPGMKLDPVKTALSSTASDDISAANKKFDTYSSKTSTMGGSIKPIIPKSSVGQISPQKPVTKQAPVASKTIQKAPVQKKALPVTNKPEADPNVGGGFVTAGVSKGPTGNLRTVNTTRGKVDSTALPHKNTSTSQPLQKARNVSYAKPQDWKQASSKTVTGSNLPPQGSAARDKALADKGYKKF